MFGSQQQPPQGWGAHPPQAPAEQWGREQQPGWPLWEYKVLDAPAAFTLEKELNRLGGEGWELCGVDSDPAHKVAKGNLYVFKRPRRH